MDSEDSLLDDVPGALLSSMTEADMEAFLSPALSLQADTPAAERKHSMPSVLTPLSDGSSLSRDNIASDAQAQPSIKLPHHKAVSQEDEAPQTPDSAGSVTSRVARRLPSSPSGSSRSPSHPTAQAERSLLPGSRLRRSSAAADGSLTARAAPAARRVAGDARDGSLTSRGARGVAAGWLGSGDGSQTARALRGSARPSSTGSGAAAASGRRQAARAASGNLTARPSGPGSGGLAAQASPAVGGREDAGAARRSSSGSLTSRPSQRRSTDSGQSSPRGGLLRKSLSSGLPSPVDATAAPSSAGLHYEYDRLRNELTASQRELRGCQEEVNTLRGTVATKDRTLAKADADVLQLKDKLLAAEQGLAAKTKELGVALAARQKALSAAEATGRQADKLQHKLATMPKANKFSEAVATLESEVKGLKAANARLAEDNRAMTNAVRAKDRDLEAAAHKVAAAEQAEIKSKELRNRVLDLQRQLEVSAEDQATLLAVQRQQQAELSRLAARADEEGERADATGRQLAGCNTDLQAAQDRVWELEQELGVLREQLTRTGAVAARAAGREVQGGSKDEGVVPVGVHLAEMQHLQGQVAQLRERVRALEAAGQVATRVQDHLRRQLSAAKSHQASGNRSVPSSPRRASPESGSSAGPRAPLTAR